jgi:ABC-type polar amino acid transport system ATPase subunit
LRPFSILADRTNALARRPINIDRALVNDPTVLLADEPTSAPDHKRGAAVLDLITRLTHHQATATVLVTHDRTHLTTVDKIAEVHFGVPVDLPIDGPPGKPRQPAVKRADDLLHYGQVRD